MRSEQTLLKVLEIAHAPQPGMAPRMASAVIQEAESYLEWLDKQQSLAQPKSARPALQVHNGGKHSMGKKKKKSYYKPTGNPPGRPRKDGRPAGSVSDEKAAA